MLRLRSRVSLVTILCHMLIIERVEVAANADYDDIDNHSYSNGTNDNNDQPNGYDVATFALSSSAIPSIDNWNVFAIESLGINVRVVTIDDYWRRYLARRNESTLYVKVANLPTGVIVSDYKGRYRVERDERIVRWVVEGALMDSMSHFLHAVPNVRVIMFDVNDPYAKLRVDFTLTFEHIDRDRYFAYEATKNATKATSIVDDATVRAKLFRHVEKYCSLYDNVSHDRLVLPYGSAIWSVGDNIVDREASLRLLGRYAPSLRWAIGHNIPHVFGLHHIGCNENVASRQRHLQTAQRSYAMTDYDSCEAKRIALLRYISDANLTLESVLWTDVFRDTNENRRALVRLLKLTNVNLRVDVVKLLETVSNTRHRSLVRSYNGYIPDRR